MIISVFETPKMTSIDKFKNKWFDSLTEEQQKEYVKEIEADYWIDYYKSFPEE